MIWNPETRRFDGPRLRQAIIMREWLAADFAEAAGLRVGCVYNALRGRPVRDHTALTIFNALASRQPIALASKAHGPAESL